MCTRRHYPAGHERSIGDTGPPFGSWPEGFAGTDSEFLLRASSILELGTGLHHLTLMADRYVADHDSLTATEIADASECSEVRRARRASTSRRPTNGVTRVYKQRIQDQLDQLDPDSIAAVITDPFEWVMAQMHGPLRASLDDVGSALAGLPVQDTALGSYLMLYSQAVDRKPLLPTMERALLITASRAPRRCSSAYCDAFSTTKAAPVVGGRCGIRQISTSKSVGSLAGASRTGNLAYSVTWDWTWRPRRATGTQSARVLSPRHVLVHNAGLADTKYVERIPSVAVGTPLEIDGEYLRNAIDLLCGFLLGVIFMAWEVLPGRRSFVLQLFTMYATSAASELRWPLAENLHALIAREESDKDDAAASQVNAWLARTHWRGPDFVIEAVQQWHTDDLARRFAVARTILLREYDPAIAMLPELLACGEITRDHLLTWPLFEPMRDMANFHRLLTD